MSCSGTSSAPCAPDALTARSVAELGSFTRWVRTNGVRGAVGEVGWPGGADTKKWNGLAERWYDAADEAQVEVSAWAAAERWPVGYPLALYRARPPARASGPRYVSGRQVPVVEGHLGGAVRRGVSLADATFGGSLDEQGTYSSARRGTYATDYVYPSAAFLRFLAGRGIRHVRLAVLWERLQPTPGAPLDRTELRRIRAVLRAAGTAGLSVEVELHNYGRYASGAGGGRKVLVLGSAELPAGALADVWRRIATALKGSPGVSGFGLMNEPYDLPGGSAGWEAVSRRAVAAIRAVDTRTTIYVGGYAHSGIATWTRQHPRPWIDPAQWPVVYEAHQYFDTTREGVYRDTYAQTNDAAVRQGWTACATSPKPS